jgi:hypothetical protein
LQAFLAKAGLALSDNSKLTSNEGHPSQAMETDCPGQLDDHPETPPSTPCHALSEVSPDHHPCSPILDTNLDLKLSPEDVQYAEGKHQGLSVRSSRYFATWPHANPDTFSSFSAQTATTSEDSGQNCLGNVKDKNQRLADDIRRLVAEIPRMKTALGGAIPEPSRSVGSHPVTVDQLEELLEDALAAKLQPMPVPHTEPTSTGQDIHTNTFDGMMVYLTRLTLTNRYY